VKLRYLEKDNASRRGVAAAYMAGLAGSSLALPRQAPAALHVYHLYVLRAQRRDALLRHLKSCGIGALVHYPLPIHLQPAYNDRLPRRQQLAETERAAREVLSLPIYPEIEPAEVERVIQAVRQFSV
jgi:dTDP-4-amino-4,6-dideoxygalactose transaminase